MTPGPVDDYLGELQRELRQRGLTNTRIIDEAREHLVDAVEDGQLRGLSRAAAEREALDRFGAPGIVAALVLQERSETMNKVAAVLSTVWHRKWWIVIPTVLTALATSLMSYYFLPTRYRSESIIRVMSPRVSAEYVHPVASEPSSAGFQLISQSILSRTRLERIVFEVGLLDNARKDTSLEDVVVQMRNNINVNVLTADDAQHKVGGFAVSFVSSDPTMAMKITERLAHLFVEESLREREVQTERTNQFIDSQIDDMRRRLVAYERTLDALRAQRGRTPLSQADVLPYEVLQERYKALLIQREEWRIVQYLEHRQVGSQFAVIDAARVPERPLGPSRLGVNIIGTFAGLGVGLVLVSVRSRSKDVSA